MSVVMTTGSQEINNFHLFLKKKKLLAQMLYIFNIHTPLGPVEAHESAF